MKFCMMSYTMSRQPGFDLTAMLELTCELRLEAVDMVSLYGNDARTVRTMLDDRGLKAACHTFGGDFCHPTAAERQPGVDTVKRSIEDAVTLGADKVMVVTPGKAGVARDEARRYYIAGLQAVAGFARDAGIVLTVENFPGADSPFIIADDVLEAIRAVPGLALTFDNGNTAMGEPPAASYARLAPHVVFAHFKDWALVEPEKGRRGLDGRWYVPALIGEGIVDQRGCLQAMKAAGYAGYINIEYEGNDYPAADAVRRALAHLQGLVAGLA